MSQQSTLEPPDGCPRWAAVIIARIRDIEIQLGNIRPDASEPWQVAKISDVYERLQADDTALHNDLVESLFVKLSRGLSEDGFDAAAIAAFINSRIPSGRLPYCSSSEVEEAQDRHAHSLGCES